jgi:hypothetical protein
MGFRFQRRVKLFPGVRLNFSGSGISTTIGVRGASVTLGPRGTYANVGLPGTGLSYRTRLDRPPRPSAPQRTPTIPLIPASPLPGVSTKPTSTEIRSGPVSTMTSPGLDEFKKLINEASARRAELEFDIPATRRELSQHQKKLRRANWFIVRLFTRRKVRRLIPDIAADERRLHENQKDLAGCSIEVDFAFDQQTKDAYDALAGSFEQLGMCARIWDITSSAAVNRVAERTTASTAVERSSVTARLGSSKLIESEKRALRLGNANGEDIYIYPGFIMMPGVTDDFALIDIRELEVTAGAQRFVEAESVPSDSQVVDHTWKKANKDGTRDRRFAGNYQIPVVLYGRLELRSHTGLHEVYQFSNVDRLVSFAKCLDDYQRAISTLAKENKDLSVIGAGASTEEPDDEGEENGTHSPHPATPPYDPPRYLAVDAICLLLILTGVAGGASYAALHFEELTKLARGPATVAQSSAAPPSVNVNSAAVAQSTLGPAAPNRAIVYVQNRTANIRAEPSTESQIVGTAKPKTKFAVFNRQGNWYEIGDSKPAGWIHQTLLGTTPPD